MAYTLLCLAPLSEHNVYVIYITVVCSGRSFILIGVQYYIVWIFHNICIYNGGLGISQFLTYCK